MLHPRAGAPAPWSEPRLTSRATTPMIPLRYLSGTPLLCPHMSALSGIVRLDEKGRLVLPAEYRRRLGVRPGDEVSITEDAGVLRVESRAAAARALIGLAGPAGPRSPLDDLKDLRREQAASEDEEVARVSRSRAVRRGH